VRVHPEVAEALRRGGPVVALESTLISHGLPAPRNLVAARQIEAAVRDAGAVPATIAVLDGEPHLGLDDAALERIVDPDTTVKASVRDLAVVATLRRTAATTVAATAHLASRSGIVVFATGGLGGVHRGARESWDESADLAALARLPILVVCSGVKSILDVGATLERLETLNVAVIGYRTDRFPGFYLADSGYPVDWRLDNPAQVAETLRARRELGTDGFGVVLANPVPAEHELDRAQHDRILAEGLAELEAAGIRGKQVTPFLLEYLHRETGGASLDANVALVLDNARVAGAVAVAAAT
jgi:pseudouridylate synthase